MRSLRVLLAIVAAGCGGGGEDTEPAPIPLPGGGQAYRLAGRVVDSDGHAIAGVRVRLIEGFMGDEVDWTGTIRWPGIHPEAGWGVEIPSEIEVAPGPVEVVAEYAPWRLGPTPPELLGYAHPLGRLYGGRDDRGRPRPLNYLYFFSAARTSSAGITPPRFQMTLSPVGSRIT